MAGKVVIVGGGIIGALTAYHLTNLHGWTEVVVIDQGDLPYNAGSTSHAPGGVVAVSHNQTLTRMAVYSSDLYGSLNQYDDKHRHYSKVGGLELARTDERMEDLVRLHGECTGWDVETHLLSPEETVERMHILDPTAFVGSLFAPKSAQIKGYHVVGDLMKRSRARGASFHAHTKLESILRSNGRVRGVTTNNPALPRIDCDHVVIAANIWTPAIRDAFGYQVPLMAYQHPYAITAPLPELAEYSPGNLDAEMSFPLLRDIDSAMYYRKHWDAMGIGSYHHAPQMVRPHDVGPSAMRPFTPDDFAEPWKLAQELIPMLRDKEPEFDTAFNGMFAFSADGMPIIGESREVKGLWSANAGWITHAAGIAKSLAEWMTTGETEWDMRACNLYRFQSHVTTPKFIERVTKKNYREIYDIVHPRQPNSDPREVRLTPMHSRHVEAGASFTTFAGYELPNWFESNEDLVKKYQDRIPERTGYAAKFWSPIVGAEHLAVRDTAGLFDVSGLSIIDVAGSGAGRFVDYLCSNRMDGPVGRVTYTCWLTRSGGIKRDLAVARMDQNRYWMFVGEGTLPQDLDWVQRNAPADVAVSNISESYAGIGLFGPNARKILQSLTEADLSDEGFGYYTGRWIDIGYARAYAMRISYVGELGWELHVPTDSSVQVWDDIRRAGEQHDLVLAGSACMDSLRIEKGYRLWGADIYTEYDVYEAGLGWTARLAKDDFIGRAATMAAKEEGLAKKLACMTIDDPACVPTGYEAILHNGEPIGNVTSANYGYSVGTTIAYGYLPIRQSDPGTILTVRFLGKDYEATVMSEPLYDPRMAKVRA
jgi:glycine cleavage system aminomethyltransferase T/glycine/D-amino acid oxidase-like deaminating enzyme